MNNFNDNFKMDPTEIREMRVNSFFLTRSQFTDFLGLHFFQKWTRRDFPTGPVIVTPVFEPEAPA